MAAQIGESALAALRSLYLHDWKTDSPWSCVDSSLASFKKKQEKVTQGSALRQDFEYERDHQV
jgi:hypothetical protein